MLKELWELYWAFFQVGIMTFGGGYAMLPMLQRIVVNEKKWADEEEIMDYYAIGQITPGVIAVNTATFIGYKQKKSIGGIAATLGVVSPSIIIILILANIIDQFSDITIVQHAFNGIRIVVCALVAKSGYQYDSERGKRYFYTRYLSDFFCCSRDFPDVTDTSRCYFLFSRYFYKRSGG